MATFKVTRVRREYPPLNRSHQHIVGVVTDDGVFHTNQEVVDSLAAGHTWRTLVPDEPEAEILPEPHCSKPWCLHSPYLSSTPGPSLATDLERMPPG